MRVQEQLNSEESFISKLLVLASAGVSLIHVRAPEVMRALTVIREKLIIDGFEYYEWDIVRGLRELRASSLGGEMFVKGDDDISIVSILAKIGAERANRDKLPSSAEVKDRYYAIVNPQFYWNNNPQLHQMIMEYFSYLAWSDIRILFITPDITLPTDLVPYFRTVELKTPSIDELEGSLRKVSGYLTDADITLVDSEYTDIAVLGSGLSQIDFELSASVAMVSANLDGDGEITSPKVKEGVSASKLEIVKRNDLLQLLPPEPMGNVGGMQALKDWVAIRKDCYTDEAKAFGIDPPKGIVLVGLPGCLTGDTIINVSREDTPTNHESMRLDYLYDRFNRVSLLIDDEWDLSIPTYAQCYKEDEGNIGFNKINKVIYSGGKAVYKVTTEQGNEVYATQDHKILTPNGYVELGNLDIGDELYYSMGNGNAPMLQKISSIWYAGRRHTYDIQMQAPYHNFVANGIVVHNCGKSLAAKAIASELGVPLIRLDIGKMFNSLLGESERQMRTALAMIEAMSPCCSESTLITLADGTAMPIGQLYAKVKNGEKFTLLGVCPDTGNLVDLSLHTIIRREGKPMLKITSESGNSVEVTRDHKLLVNRNEERVWVEAEHILPGDDLVEV